MSMRMCAQVVAPPLPMLCGDSTLRCEQKQVENIVLTPGRQASIDRRAKEDLQIMSEMLLQWDERARSDVYYMDSMARRDTRLSALKLMDVGQYHKQ